LSEVQGKVLIVDDDTALRRSLRTTLKILGFEIGEAGNGEDALASVRAAAYNAVLLDINMPGLGGIETCTRMRRVFTRLPFIMLTVRGSEEDKVRALDAGADDYVTKPFQVRELAARLRAAIRRYRAPEAPEDEPITVGEITLDPARHCAERDGKEVHLTPLEFETLKILMSQAGRPVTHARLHAALHLPGDFANRGHLRVLIGQLRRKLGDSSTNPTYILTDGDIGYRFREP
jgi:two-component system, OmpR family, KDP operon response regulator KdpE